MNDEFSAEDFCTVIFDEFFFAGLARDNVPKHLLKLLWYIYPKLPTVRLQTLVKALQPTSQVKMKEAWVSVGCMALRITYCFSGNSLCGVSMIAFCIVTLKCLGLLISSTQCSLVLCEEMEIHMETESCANLTK
jgi:hypothetical protein